MHAHRWQGTRVRGGRPSCASTIVTSELARKLPQAEEDGCFFFVFEMEDFVPSPSPLLRPFFQPTPDDGECCAEVCRAPQPPR